MEEGQTEKKKRLRKARLCRSSVKAFALPVVSVTAELLCVVITEAASVKQ